MDVGNAVYDATGASFEYQQLDLELRGLKRILEYLEALRPTANNSSHINAIRCLALTCYRDCPTAVAKLTRSRHASWPLRLGVHPYKPTVHQVGGDWKGRASNI